MYQEKCYDKNRVMRIYEFSKELDIPAKDILQALEEEGFSVKSHMSALSQDAIDFLHKRFGAKESQKETPKEEKK